MSVPEDTFTVDGVLFDHYPMRSEPDRPFYKVRWEDKKGAGRMIREADGTWYGCDVTSGNTFFGAVDRDEAVRRIVAGDWDDFTFDGVEFCMTASAKTTSRAYFDVWWDDPEAGTLFLALDDGGWHGRNHDMSGMFVGVTDRAEAMRRMVAKEWDPAG